MFPGENGESHGGIVLFCILKCTPDCRQYRRHGLKGEITKLEDEHKVGLGTSTMRIPSGKIAWQKYNIKFLTYFAKSLSSKKAEDAGREMTFLDFHQSDCNGGCISGEEITRNLKQW